MYSYFYYYGIFTCLKKVKKYDLTTLYKCVTFKNLICICINNMLINNQRGYTGLINVGNTCYMNSVIQTLAHNKSLRDYYLSQTFVDNKNSLYRNLFKNFIILLNEIWKTNAVIKPVSFRNSINFVFKKYNNKEQHDANEFLLDFLDFLHTYSSKKDVKIYNTNSSTKYKNAMMQRRKTLKELSSFISNEFYGQYIIGKKCNVCDEKTYDYEVFTSLFLNIPKKITSCDVNYLLNKHFLLDYQNLDCVGECNIDSLDDAKKNPEHKISKKFFKLPKTLVITINRYSTTNIKNNLKLTPNETLNVERYYTTNKSDSVIYKLSSIICYNGDTIDSGHYYTVINRGGTYYTYNDHQIITTDLTKVNFSDFYIFFYTKQN